MAMGCLLVRLVWQLIKNFVEARQSNRRLGEVDSLDVAIVPWSLYNRALGSLCAGFL